MEKFTIEFEPGDDVEIIYQGQVWKVKSVWGTVDDDGSGFIDLVRKEVPNV